MTFKKAVGAYLTGWLIAQPLFTLVMRRIRGREIAHPPEDLRAYWRHQAKAIVDEIERRPDLQAAIQRLTDEVGYLVRLRHRLEELSPERARHNQERPLADDETGLVP